MSGVIYLGYRLISSTSLKPASNNTIYIILDTNILLHHLKILKNLVEDIAFASIPISVICPGVVLNELDLYVPLHIMSSCLTDNAVVGAVKPEKSTFAGASG